MPSFPALLGTATRDVNPQALLGTTTRDAILFRHCSAQQLDDIARYNSLRHHPSNTLLSTTTQDVILYDITWNHNSRCYPPQHCSGAMAWDVNHRDTAWRITLRCQSQQQRSRKMTWGVVSIIISFVWAHPKSVVFDLCPINDPHECAKRGSYRHLILSRLTINKTSVNTS